MSYSYKEHRARKINMLRSTAEGVRVAHVWQSPLYPGANMVIQYRWPDVAVREDEHGLPPEFAASVELEYAGMMSKDEAAQRLADMQIAYRAQEGSTNA
jgi:hypothetical protein